MCFIRDVELPGLKFEPCSLGHALPLPRPPPPWPRRHPAPPRPLHKLTLGHLECLLPCEDPKGMPPSTSAAQQGPLVHLLKSLYMNTIRDRYIVTVYYQG